MEPNDELDLTDLEALVLVLLDQGDITMDADDEDARGETS